MGILKWRIKYSDVQCPKCGSYMGDYMTTLKCELCGYHICTSDVNKCDKCKKEAHNVRL